MNPAPPPPPPPPLIGTTDLAAVANWLVGPNTGTSSEYLLATALAGRIPEKARGRGYPGDTSDINRCFLLIEAAPWVREIAFPVLREANPWWRVLIDHWGELERLSRQAKMNTWTRVNDRMKELFATIK